MFSAKTFTVLILLMLFCLTSDCDAWRRRRRRRAPPPCPVKNCDITLWSYWSYCSTDQCGQQGSQSRSRTVVSEPSCGGTECPDNLSETRQCSGSKAVDCKLSHWSEWSGCTTVCGVLGTQSSVRHRITIEQCGGTCSSSLIKTRSCQQTGCFNGGSLREGVCSCRAGFSGDCCELQGETWRCGGLGPVDCHLSSWSEWGPCTTMCGVGGRQTSTRRRLITEQCGGTCPGGLNLKITRACPQIRCFNGGRLMHGACKCNVGYSGDCCEYTENTKKDTDTDTNTGSIKIKVAISVPGVVVLFVIIFCVCWRYFKE